MGIHMTELSDEVKLAVTLARKSAKQQDDMLRSKIENVRRERDRCVEALLMSAEIQG